MSDFKEPFVIPSKGKSGAVKLFRENLLIPEGVEFPTIEIASKLTKSEHFKDFSINNQLKITNELGYYSDLQSIKSEDAITWSLFGYVAYQNKKIRLQFLNELLEKLNLTQDTNCEIKLWQRLPHPETFGSGGPEMDVIILGSRHLLLVECKWGAGIGKNQGKNKNKNQIEIRNEWKKVLGEKLYPNHEINIVIVANENVEPNELFVSWKDFCDFENLPHKELYHSYYKWKKQWLK